MAEVQTLFFSLLGGILPALLWLWFWLREDKMHPEPRRLLFLSFIGGMVAVALALPLEKFAERMIVNGTLIIIAWSLIEEILKLGAAYLGGLDRKDCDEPLDPMIYLITAALGFAAAENTLFLLSSVKEGFLDGMLTGNLRFIGASLLHVLCSALIGVFMALSFYKKTYIKIIYLTVGIIAAVAAHFLFNYYVMKSQAGGTFLVFSLVWVAIIGLLLIFEKIKKIRQI
ncbi:MAG: hypothetical protein A3H57_00735 [Candidatus Taylorbacteria bacterium RIFCSPLOWO2_02_FULL_43_11]|uniref:Protease PrsW n=1 Tax=Candidatus Taylorbacteria bacterium RIFCSPHIGHO2_02_FULL_43_32b TaxID=1802306 RepID=A0A1G2MK76_9BACT|nr:MAG: hypothetical protein A2743_00760 [Candidatus Taylorbacteria bacterium RIFCSPHIGHO2_01_FULL_43_47]OHA23421.1 MAG: hypothetical protein A3C72_00435 [Candidatus Taylorbacteria bacterium RIFCSPHIGHO2_02_FULL_43_32b]OHA30417.1 MAG: hypothetical protein A3B08_02750 [Candidatus Taylorbacteria bacterium RIFCSPLOWO2_01_FULL_43_44]OHA36962.1 MAG: hypothetical protein A3H57_00735 [Candidatus Taylorbacteria bacterium RIFCSPLOWO2_02_FULL_43_11]